MVHHIDVLWGSQLQQTQSPPQTRRVGLLSDATKTPAGLGWTHGGFSLSIATGALMESKEILQFDLVRSIDIGGILNIHVHAICTCYMYILYTVSLRLIMSLFALIQNIPVFVCGMAWSDSRWQQIRSSEFFKPQLVDCRDYKNQYIMVRMENNGWLLITWDEY